MDPLTIGIIVVGLFLFGGGGATKAKYAVIGKKEGVEPDQAPGPIVFEKKAVVQDDAEAALEEYRNKLEALISQAPTAEHFYQIYNGGPNASTIAGDILSAHNANTGQNRVRLIKCMTQIPWNKKRYTSKRKSSSWGTLYDVNEENLSAAWLPRHAPAVQLLAETVSPPRTITPGGAWVQGQGTYYALLWIPKIKVVSGELVCDPLAEGPPAWLLDRIGGS